MAGRTPFSVVYDAVFRGKSTISYTHQSYLKLSHLVSVGQDMCVPQRSTQLYFPCGAHIWAVFQAQIGNRSILSRTMGIVSERDYLAEI